MRTWSLRVFRQAFRLALSALHMLAVATSAAFKSRATLHLENAALRHQLGVSGRWQAEVLLRNQSILSESRGCGQKTGLPDFIRRASPADGHFPQTHIIPDPRSIGCRVAAVRLPSRAFSDQSGDIGKRCATYPANLCPFSG
jgi:hypothetical protein